MRHGLLPLLCPALLLSLPAAAPAQTAAARPDPAAVEFFEKRVRPTLAEHCYQCHGPDKQKGGLRLDSRAALLQGGDSGPAVVPGEPGKSRLIQAVEHRDDLRMPPKKKLSDAEVAALAAWVKQGAPWPAAVETRVAEKKGMKVTAKDRAFWSFQPVREPPLPPVQDAAWARTPLDRFILARLEEKGLRPAP